MTTKISIKAGNKYVTRHGEVVGPMQPRDGIAATFSSPSHPGGRWNIFGQFTDTWTGTSNLDLVGEFKELDDLPLETFGPLTQTGEADRTKQHLADEALRITSGARRAAYGPPENNFERIARFWQAYMQNTGRDVTITAADVSPMMRLMKEARLCETPDHLDSFVDLVGYTLTGAEVNKVRAPD